MDAAVAARKIPVPEERLRGWEADTDQPTVKQLQKLASIYQQPLAAFFLPKPPAVFQIPGLDYRRLTDGTQPPSASSELALDIRRSLDRREICLEMLAELGEQAPKFEFSTDLGQPPEKVAAEIRAKLGIEPGAWKKWPDTGKAFSAWRAAIERAGVLVFQARGISVDEMRGCALAEFPLPIVVVNRKDAYAGRIFSLIHEFAHLALRKSGLCDTDDQSERTSGERGRVETFCNQVAGATLVPEEALAGEPVVAGHRGMKWSDDELTRLANSFSVSREVILRRCLTLEMTTPEFYRQKRREFLREYERRDGPVRPAPISPAVDTISAVGKPYIRGVLNALHDGHITASDASSYLNLRLQHFPELEKRL